MEKKSELYFDHQWLVNTVGSFQKHLRKEKGYELVLFAGVDEIVVPDPNVYAGGLTQYLNEFKGEGASVTAYEVVHDPDTEPKKSMTTSLFSSSGGTSCGTNSTTKPF